MAAKSIQTKSRKNGTTAQQLAGPVRATHSFGLTAKDLELGTVRPAGHYRTVDQYLFQQNSARPTSCDVRRSSSPDSPHFSRKVKNGLSPGSGVHRSSSFDAISSSFYLNGTWPRVGRVNDTLQLSEGQNDSEKETQTPKDWRAERLRYGPGSLVSCSASGPVDNLREIRARLKTTKEGNAMRCSPALPLVVNFPPSTLPKSLTDSVRCRRHRHHKRGAHHSRGSLEGLNQELEKLDVLNSSMDEIYRHDGRRAPVTDLLTLDLGNGPNGPVTAGEEVLAVELDSLAVADGEPADTGFCSISSPRAATSSVDLPSDKHEELQTMDQYGTSPPKFILTRLPPEGCENVICKLNESSRNLSVEPEATVELATIVKPAVVACHIPSESSAFYPPLFRKYISQPNEMLSGMTSDHLRVVCLRNSE